MTDSEESMESYYDSGTVTESDTEYDDEENENIRGPWFPVFNTEHFRMPEMEAFRDDHPGPVDIRHDDKPHEIFLSMLADPQNLECNMIDILVEETNRYANQKILQENIKPHSRLRSWSPVDNQEMKAFVGFLLLMGLVKKPSITSYWEILDKNWLTSTPAFGSVMPRDRFLAILSNLHASNNDLAVPRDHPQYDPMFKARPAIDVCNKAFRENYRLSRDICVDERLVGFKGRHNIVQYISKKKSHQWGAKIWVLSESDTGYTENVKKVYYGRRNQNQPFPFGIGYDVVTKLMEPHMHKYHHLTTDSLFTSPKLTHYLLENETYSTGTVIAGRKGMPVSFKTLKTPKGTVTAKKQGGVLAIQWSDRRQVRFLTSSDHCRMETATNSKGKEKTAPGVVHTYNEKMGGVDLGDQLISVYDPNIRSVKLWKKIVINLILTACVNAYICYKRSFLLQKKMTHLAFQREIVTGLVGQTRVRERIPRNGLGIAGRFRSEHQLYYIPEGKRRKCVFCKNHKVRTWCKKCTIGLCLGACFEDYHRNIDLRREE